MWVRGLKLFRYAAADRQMASHPVWVRGLKPPYIAPTPEGIVSHPVWVRGLKLLSHFNPLCLSDVAPRVGAWIETRG